MDIAKIDAITDHMVASGHRLYQIHRFAKSVADHVRRLAIWMDCPHKARVIDMGCGIGEMAKILNNHLPDLSFCLVNLSKAQLSYIDDRHESICCDFIHVPKPASSFDVVMFCFSIGHADLADSMKEAHRLLKPGGILFIYDMVRVSGDNSSMEDVDYVVNDRATMEDAAIGFQLDFYMEPQDDGNYGRRTLGKEFDRVFSGTIPAIWRFIKK